MQYGIKGTLDNIKWGLHKGTISESCLLKKKLSKRLETVLKGSHVELSKKDLYVIGDQSDLLDEADTESEAHVWIQRSKKKSENNRVLGEFLCETMSTITTISIIISQRRVNKMLLIDFYNSNLVTTCRNITELRFNKAMHSEHQVKSCLILGIEEGQFRYRNTLNTNNYSIRNRIDEQNSVGYSSNKKQIFSHYGDKQDMKINSNQTRMINITQKKSLTTSVKDERFPRKKKCIFR
ncbi:hypothetical protein BD560DRAFT_427682 [Blakeslea trispora]|nr:hypothetical protein BD560DRAFT_427682 [Blakeslea trispora]